MENGDEIRIAVSCSRCGVRYERALEAVDAPRPWRCDFCGGAVVTEEVKVPMEEPPRVARRFPFLRALLRRP